MINTSETRWFDFDFRIFDDPNKLRRTIEEKNKLNNKSRIIAGYCWDWKSKKNSALTDVIIPEHDFEMTWNLTKDGSNWIIAEDSINEIGCIHTCQGLELDYVGVIVGPDLKLVNGEITTDVYARSKMDQSIRGIKKMIKESPEEAFALARKLILNTYRVLMTRGMKGCYVYFCNTELRDLVKSKLSMTNYYYTQEGLSIAAEPDDEYE